MLAALACRSSLHSRQIPAMANSVRLSATANQWVTFGGVSVHLQSEAARLIVLAAGFARILTPASRFSPPRALLRGISALSRRDRRLARETTCPALPSYRRPSAIPPTG